MLSWLLILLPSVTLLALAMRWLYFYMEKVGKEDKSNSRYLVWKFLEKPAEMFGI